MLIDDIGVLLLAPYSLTPHGPKNGGTWDTWTRASSIKTIDILPDLKVRGFWKDITICSSCLTGS